MKDQSDTQSELLHLAPTTYIHPSIHEAFVSQPSDKPNLRLFLLLGTVVNVIIISSIFLFVYQFKQLSEDYHIYDKETKYNYIKFDRMNNNLLQKGRNKEKERELIILLQDMKQDSEMLVKTVKQIYASPIPRIVGVSVTSRDREIQYYEQLDRMLGAFLEYFTEDIKDNPDYQTLQALANNTREQAIALEDIVPKMSKDSPRRDALLQYILKNYVLLIPFTFIGLLGFNLFVVGMLKGEKSLAINKSIAIQYFAYSSLNALALVVYFYVFFLLTYL